MIKKIALVGISIVSVIVVAGAVVAALMFFVGDNKKDETANITPETAVKNDPSKSDPSKQEQYGDVDLSKDLGACTVVVKADIVAALGGSIPAIADGKNRGYALDSAGNGLQSCIYAFSDDNAINNRFSVTVMVYKTDALLAASKDVFNDTQKVELASGEGYFLTTSVPESAQTPAQNDYSLFVFKDNKLYQFTISRPADIDTFTATAAQTALVAIVATATF